MRMITEVTEHKRRMLELSDELAAQKDHNSMKMMVVELFNSRLKVLEAQAVTALGMHTATIELLREISAKPASAPMSEREVRALEFARQFGNL